MSFYGKDFDHNGRVDAHDYYIFNEVTGGGGDSGSSGGSGCCSEGLSLIIRALIILQIFIWICRLIG